MIDTYNVIKLTGTTNTEMHTKSTVQLTIKNTPTTFHVIAEELPLAVNGILGIGFLQQEYAELAFHHGTMVLSSDPIRPIPFQEVYEGNRFLKPTLGLTH